MRFRLVYEGELKARQRSPETNQRDRLAEHKQQIRKVFHKQLKHLWKTNRFLKEHRLFPNSTLSTRPASNTAVWGGGENEMISLAEYVAARYQEHGYSFVPLVLDGYSLFCSLEILFMRRDFPGSLISAGDLDNRIKTLIDALRKPEGANEFRGNETPAEGEDPFFCLLEDDKLVSKLSVETDTLLDPPAGNRDEDRRQVRVVITVDLKPYDVTMFNLSFA